MTIGNWTAVSYSYFCNLWKQWSTFLLSYRCFRIWPTIIGSFSLFSNPYHLLERLALAVMIGSERLQSSPWLAAVHRLLPCSVLSAEPKNRTTCIEIHPALSGAILVILAQRYLGNDLCPAKLEKRWDNEPTLPCTTEVASRLERNIYFFFRPFLLLLFPFLWQRPILEEAACLSIGGRRYCYRRRRFCDRAYNKYREIPGLVSVRRLEKSTWFSNYFL